MGLIGTMIQTHIGGKMSKNEIKKIQNKRLKKLVKYARRNSSYFKNLYSNINSDFSLEELPTTNKI